jgi:hypothetical protein
MVHVECLEHTIWVTGHETPDTAAVKCSGDPGHRTRFVVCPIGRMSLEVTALSCSDPRIMQSIGSTLHSFTASLWPVYRCPLA